MKATDLALAFKRYSLNERGIRPQSYRSIMASVNMLCAWACTEDIASLGTGTVQAFLYWGREERGWEARTFRNHRQYLKSFFAWCVKQNYLHANPVDNIEAPKLPQRLPRCLSRIDVQTILSRVRWYPWRYRFEAIRNETLLNVLVLTGLRLQEALDLEMGDVNISAGEILVRQGKGRKDRLVPVHPRLLPVLRNYLAARKDRRNFSSYFFTGAVSEQPMSGKDVRTICQKLARDTGIYFTPHMLRHTFGRLSVEGGLDIFKIKEVMGHAHISTTQTYLSVSTENIKQSFSEISLL